MKYKQPLCEDCWEQVYDKPPPQKRETKIELEFCCMCGNATKSGIHIRVERKTVKFPQ